MVRRVPKGALAHIPGILPESPIDVLQKGFGESALLFEVRVPIDNRATAHRIMSHIHFAMWYACKRENITIPFPIRTVEFYNMRRMPTEHLVSDKKALHSVDFFRELPDTEVQTILEKADHRVFGQGEFICHRGDPADTLYIILAGQVDIIAPVPSKRLVRLGTGAVFGEMGIMDGGVRKADVVAHCDVMLLAIPGPDFAEMLAQNPAVATWFQNLLLERQHRLET